MTQIYGCYQKDLFADPETFALALLTVLSKFPQDIVKETCDPLTGIVRAYPHRPPNIGEVINFMEGAQRRRASISERAAAMRAQLAERDAFDRQAKEESPDQRTAAVERCFAELRKRGGEFQKLGNVAAKVVGQQEAPPCDDGERPERNIA